MIRIVGLSATLPNYKDVGAFLGINEDTGLFYFDASYRPVPLEMQFVGVTEKNLFASKVIMDDVCYDKVSGASYPGLCLPPRPSCLVIHPCMKPSRAPGTEPWCECSPSSASGAGCRDDEQQLDS